MQIYHEREAQRWALWTVLATAAIGCGDDDRASKGVALSPSEAPTQQWKKREVKAQLGDDCDAKDGPACKSSDGVAGTCMKGYCLANGPGCIRDIDCFDGNPCTIERCDKGRCVADFAAAKCEVAKRPGTCSTGKCVLEGSLACSKDQDCAPVTTPCTEAVCAQGVCSVSAVAKGEACRLVSGAPGTCNEHKVCILDPVAAKEGAERCRMRWVRYGYRRVRKKKCTKGLRYTIDDERLSAQREKVRKVIERQVRYDTHVGIIALADGGYNLNITNARERHDIRGLIDPSFVAFALATFTGKTNWKSRNLNIWLQPLREGWYIPTHGSRTAMRKGRAASALGRWGVVDVKTYRKWLEKNFKPMPVPTDR